MDKSINLMDTLRGNPAKSGVYSLIPGMVLGQYRILRPLGRGGMGEVYEAENVVNRKCVALKVLPRAAVGGTFVERFRIESRVMMDLDHPGIVRVHHAGEENGLYYLTMDLMKGSKGEPESLEDRLAARSGGAGLPEAEVRRMALLLCEALTHAHARGVVHRDLKPANLLLNADGAIKVTDFGLAKVLGSDYLRSVIDRSVSLSLASTDENSQGDTRKDSGIKPSSSARALLGTYDYMAPEQKSGDEVGPWTDIYAFGVLLYRLLTGRKPEGMAKPPSHYGVNRRWDAIIGKCLEPDPAKRWQSVEELKTALGRRSLTWRYSVMSVGVAILAVVSTVAIRFHNTAVEIEHSTTAVITAQNSVTQEQVGVTKESGIKSVLHFKDRHGQRYAVPEDELVEFHAKVSDAIALNRFRGPDNREFEVPQSDLEAFFAEVPSAERVRTIEVKDGQRFTLTDQEWTRFLEIYRRDPSLATYREVKRDAGVAPAKSATGTDLTSDE